MWMTALTKRRAQAREKARLVVRRKAMAAAIGALMIFSAAPAAAQSDTRALYDRIERMERDLATMQRQVYRGPASGGSTVITSPALGGGVSGGGAEPMPTEAASGFEVRLSQLESELRNLTGRLEEAAFGITQMNSRLDRMTADFELRMKELEQPGSGGAAPLAPTAAAPVPPSAAAPAPADAAPQLIPPGQQGVLGTMSPKDLKAVAPQAPAAAPAIAAGTPQEQYEQAFTLMRQSDFPSAERAWLAFLKAYPSDALAGNAQYWLGETYYVRGDYQQAAVVFLQGYQKYPKNAKAPDSLLKLGLSLGSLGQKKEACAALARLGTEFPDAADALKRRATTERQKLGCS